jgi:hypothetical protein
MKLYRKTGNREVPCDFGSSHMAAELAVKSVTVDPDQQGDADQPVRVAVDRQGRNYTEMNGQFDPPGRWFGPDGGVWSEELPAGPCVDVTGRRLQ